MDTADGLAIDNAETVIPWDITPRRLAGITGQEALTQVKRDDYVTRCSVLGGPDPVMLSEEKHLAGTGSSLPHV